MGGWDTSQENSTMSSMHASYVTMVLVPLGSLREENTPFLRGVVQLEPEAWRGVGDDSPGMLYFLRIGIASKMHDVLTPSKGHEENSGRYHECQAVQSSNITDVRCG